MDTLHCLLMANHLLFQKFLLINIRDTGLTLGQPKVLDYLREHDGAFQKEIAGACQIEPATITSVLAGMEKKGLVTRHTMNGNRRNLHVYLTDKGKTFAERIQSEFNLIEQKALENFTEEEKELLITMMNRIFTNMTGGND